MAGSDYTPRLIQVSPDASTETKFAAMQSNFLLGIDRPPSDNEIQFMGDLGRCVLKPDPADKPDQDSPKTFNPTALFDGLAKELEAVRALRDTAEQLIQESIK